MAHILALTARMVNHLYRDQCEKWSA